MVKFYSNRKRFWNLDHSKMHKKWAWSLGWKSIMNDRRRLDSSQVHVHTSWKQQQCSCCRFCNSFSLTDLEILLPHISARSSSKKMVANVESLRILMFSTILEEVVDYLLQTICSYISVTYSILVDMNGFARLRCYEQLCTLSNKYWKQKLL